MGPDRRSLWRAYAIAPAVAPLSFCALLVLVAFGAPDLVCSIRVGATRLGGQIAREGEPVCE